MSEPLRALVVGLGAVGSRYDSASARERPPLSHAGAYVAAARTELVAGVDPSPAARADFAARWAVPVYETLGEALHSHRYDVVSVCTPPATHESIVTAILPSRPRAVWCEKPLGTTSAQAEAIAAACAAAGVAVQVNFLRRFDPLHRRLWGELGTVTRIDVRYNGTLLNYGTHALDLVRWFAGEPAWVHAFGADTNGGQVMIETRSGASASLIQVPSGDIDVFDVDVYSSEGRAILTALGEQLLRAPPRRSDLFDGVIRWEFAGNIEQGGLAEAMLGGVASIAAHLDAGQPLLCDGGDGVAAMRLHDAIVRSLPSDSPGGETGWAAS